MKKAVGGCLIVGLLILVIGGAAAWFVVIKPLWEVGSEVVSAGQQWMQVAELEAKVRNTAPFAEPADLRLDAAQVQRFVAVQSVIEAALGPDWKALEEKYDDLKRRLKADDREPTLQELFGAYNDLSSIILTAKQAQVDALNAHAMSLAEYRYLRTQAYLAAGIALGDETPKPLEGGTAAHNADLLRPHRELLKRTMATAWLGF